MKRTLARILIRIGQALTATGRKLDPPAARMTVELPRRAYRPAAPRGWGFNITPAIWAIG